MERIIHLFSELQEEIVSFIDRANRQLATPRCDYGCKHCHERSPRKENVEDSRCTDGDAYTPDEDERFEQSEIQISGVIENYSNKSSDNEGNHRNGTSSVAYLLPSENEIPEEMTISEDSLEMGDNEDRNQDTQCGNQNEDEHDAGEEEKENHVQKEECSKDLDETASSTGDHAKLAERSCTYCDRIFPFPYLVRRHETVHSGSCPFKCIGCKSSFQFRAELRKHRLECPDAALTCRECGVLFSHAKKLKQHIVQTHSTKLRPKEATAKHVNSKLAIQKLTMPKLAIQKQATPKANRNVKRLKCPICTRLFGNNSALAKHMTTHSDVSRLECTECGKKYSYLERLKSHYRSTHPDVPFNLEE